MSTFCGATDRGWLSSSCVLITSDARAERKVRLGYQDGVRAEQICERNARSITAECVLVQTP